jgi:predicted methyltransferase MtxX (methanogen marker protein 4)
MGALRGELTAQAVRKAVQAGLHRAVGRRASGRDQSEPRGDEYERVGLRPPLEHFTRQVHGGGEVQRHLGIEGRIGVLAGRIVSLLERTGVVDQHVQTPEAISDCLQQRCPIGCVRHIGLHGQRLRVCLRESVKRSL